MITTIKRQTIRTAPTPVQSVRVMTLKERIVDMRTHSREVCKTQVLAVAFLQRAGILNTVGDLAEPYCD